MVLDTVAGQQNAQRWAFYDPDNVLHFRRVKKDIPNALLVHIIRDGRDIALSLKKMRGFAPLPWDRDETSSLVATALYWKWMVHHGREAGCLFPADYIEIRYEDLITNPRETLGRLGGFIDHGLDYDRVQQASLGSLSKTNSSFKEEAAKEKINPLRRWKERLSPANVAAIESTVGDCLEENGYQLSLPANQRRISPRHSIMSAVYPAFLSSKLWLKVNTPVGRLANMSALELIRRTGAGRRDGVALQTIMNTATKTPDVQARAASPGAPPSTPRSLAPVFVLGCGRSGTKFLYHTLLSGGGFAVYFAESNTFNLLGVRFGNLARRANRRKLLDTYYKSNLFERTGLKREDVDERVMNDCRNAGDFLRIVMEAMARRQGVPRWAECTPLHLLNLPLIKRLVPDALIIHIIRDGRDVTAPCTASDGSVLSAGTAAAPALCRPFSGAGLSAKAAATVVRWAATTWKFTTRMWYAIRAKRWPRSASSSSRTWTMITSSKWRSVRCTIQILRFAAMARRLRRRQLGAGRRTSRPARCATSRASRPTCCERPDMR